MKKKSYENWLQNDKHYRTSSLMITIIEWFFFVDWMNFIQFIYQIKIDMRVRAHLHIKYHGIFWFHHFIVIHFEWIDRLNVNMFDIYPKQGENNFIIWNQFKFQSFHLIWFDIVLKQKQIEKIVYLNKRKFCFVGILIEFFSK